MDILGISVYADIAPWQFAVLCAIYVFSFFVKGVVGYGAALPAVLFGALILEPHYAVLLAAFVNLYTQVQWVHVSIRDGDWRIISRVLIFFLPAVGLGVYAFSEATPGVLKIVLSATVFLFVIAEWLNLFDKLRSAAESRFNIVFPVSALLSGVIGGMIGGGGLIMISTVIKVMMKEARRFRGTLLGVANFMLLLRFGIFIVAGFVTTGLLVEALILLPFSMLGGWLGNRMFASLSDQRFFMLLRGVMLTAALVLLGRAVFDTGILG